METVSILGCGWLGLPLGARLAANGWYVKGSTTTLEKLPHLQEAGIEPYLLQLGDDEMAGERRAFFDTDLLFINIPPRRNGPGYIRRIRLVRDRLRGEGVKRIILASSTSVYEPDGGEVTEESPVREDSEMVPAERLLLEESEPSTVVLRLGGLYGYDRQPGRFLAGRTGLEGGQAPVNLVHRDDVLRVIECILARPDLHGVFNVCSDVHPVRASFYSAMAQRLGLTPPEFTPSEHPSGKTVSNERLKAVLGYSFLYPDPLQPAP